MKSNSVIILLLCLIIVLLIYDIFFKTNYSPALPNETKVLKEISKKDSVSYDTLNPFSKANLTATIIDSKNNTYGYEIRMNGKVLVYQSNIPGFPGNEGFSKIDEAQKVANLVISKIRKNQIPPIITQPELDSLKVLEKNTKY